MTKFIIKGFAKVIGITFVGATVYYLGWFEGHHGISYREWFYKSLDKLEDETESKRISK